MKNGDEYRPWLTREGKLFCPFCSHDGVQVKLEFHHSYVFHTTFDKLHEVGMFARDECWKCPRCSYVPKFGFPLTEQEFKDTVDAWGGYMDWANEEGLEEVKKRLKSLGYW